MLPLKKSRDARGAAGVQPWHTDFRNASLLPDAKVIRTTFFINVAAGLGAVVALMMVVFQELSIANLRDQIAQLDAEISRDRPPSQSAAVLFAEYQVEERKIIEFEAFTKLDRPELSVFLLRLGKSIPANISVSSVEYSSGVSMLRGFVIGTPEQAATLVSAYEKQLQLDEVIGKVFEKITLTDLKRVAEGSDRLTFEISLRASKNAANSSKKP